MCFYLGYALTNKYVAPLDISVYRNNIIICNLIWVVSSGFFRLYSTNTIQVLELVYKATWKTFAIHSLLFLTSLFFNSALNFPKSYILIFYGVLFLSLVISRFTGTALQTLLNKKFDIRKTVGILNLNNKGTSLANYLTRQSSVNYVEMFEGEPASVNEYGELVMPSAKLQLQAAVNSGIDEVFVTMDRSNIHEMTTLVKEGEKQCVRLKFVPDMQDLEDNFKMDRMGDFTVLSARCEPLESMENRFKKRLFDIVVSLGVIVFVLSWLYPLLAIIIKIQSRGPVLFRQLRTGRDNKPFWCYKFRSMNMNSESEMRQASLTDDRITPIGRFMRKTSLDEFPQFFNVLFGYMSIIGPRPHMLAHTEQYRDIVDRYMVRQFLKPGISGWAQVNGYRGETSETVLMEKRVEYDIHYMSNWSLMMDVRIIFLTVINIFQGEKNAY
jgi:putative colanic acid biosynthesis UDP-glucose lipid carrier transferase